jgi:hypothetical protein
MEAWKIGNIESADTEHTVLVSESYRLWAKLVPQKPYVDKEEIEAYLNMIGKQTVNPESFSS